MTKLTNLQYEQLLIIDILADKLSMETFIYKMNHAITCRSLEHTGAVYDSEQAHYQQELQEGRHKPVLHSSFTGLEIPSVYIRRSSSQDPKYGIEIWAVDARNGTIEIEHREYRPTYIGNTDLSTRHQHFTLRTHRCVDQYIDAIRREVKSLKRYQKTITGVQQ